MKRLLLRIGALGTVVVLGLIAIAQAQRGAQNPPSADNSAAASTAPSSEGAPKPILVSADSPLRRPGIPAASAVHPLRHKAPAAAPIEKASPLRMAIGDRRPSDTVADRAPAEPPGRRPSADQFGLRAGNRRPSSGPTAVRTVAGEEELAAVPPRRTGTQPARYPELIAPARTAPSDAQRYPQSGPVASRPREPAPFRPDPLAAPSSISPPGGTAPGSFAGSAATASSNFNMPASRSASGGPVPSREGTGQPGSKALEGPQNPQLTIQKVAPKQIQVGKPATFRVSVRNTGTVAASGVEVRDRVPKGTRLISSTPRASRGAAGELVWVLGTIKPGEESSIKIQLMPTAEGEIGSVATVHFSAEVTARSIATKPELALKSSAPAQVLIGEEVVLSIEISNSGSGTATGVVLEERIPAGLQHSAGGDLEYEVGDLPPGESRKLELTLTASRPGPITNVLSIRADGNLRIEDRIQLEVIAPQLDIAMAGPKRRYLEREATYKLSVRNPGTAPAEQVELVAYLPSGLKFISANNAGQYEEADRAVHWRLEELPASETGTVELVTMPVEEGSQNIRLRGTARKGLSVEREQPVVVQGIAAIMFQAVDVTDPIEVGGETTYEIRVLNQGSKAATNVRLAVMLPPQLRATAAEGPTRHSLDGSRVLFDGLARLAPKADTTYRVRVQALQPGDMRTRVQLLTDEMQGPVTKEESTRVYSDE